MTQEALWQKVHSSWTLRGLDILWRRYRAAVNLCARYTEQLFLGNLGRNASVYANCHDSAEH
ncbi:hypothetical protein [Agrilactobacillus composti]|uniref:hypothetical protein n=1 Tax=Agrilactobacillus composti TaxID=398555 RepID=UPI00126812B9|nr:hypothetical protein [Agrilactobacillus composti]